MVDLSYDPLIYREQGAKRMVVASGGSFDVESGGEIDIESGGSLKLAGTAVSASAAELNETFLTTRIPDISSASSVWVVAPHAGTIVKIYSVIDGAISAADAVLDPQLGGTSITGGGITIANASSAAGDVDSSTPTALNVVAAGDAIEIATDGGSTGAVAAEITIVLSR